MQKYEDEKQRVIEWLEDPHELGKKPSKIEFTKEFTDEDGINCKIFKYKKSLMAPWMLAICSDSGVFSEMQNYNEATEVEDAQKLVDFLKEYWKRMANAAQEKEEMDANAEAFHAFVLMKEAKGIPENFEKEIADQWGITLEEEEKDKKKTEEDSDVDARIYQVGKLRLILGYMGFAVPNEEAEQNAAYNYMWKDAVEVTKLHSAHMVVTVLGEGTPEEKGFLYAKAITTLCRQENTIGVYANEVVYEPKFFVAMSEMIENGDLPLFDLIWFGLCNGENGVSAYTCGMKCFGKDEMEIIDSKENPGEIRELLINIATYVVFEDVILHDGETIGMSAEQRLKISKSEGINVKGDSLKITF
ncbi:MAG: DUF4261 domain-containing protein [Lachnospiraceae bacterium]